MTGGTTDGFFLIDRDGAKEYREVSNDGTEENTKQQSRSHETLVREQEVQHTTLVPISVITTEEGASVVNPSYKMPWGGSFAAGGTYIIVGDRFSTRGRGSDILVETQVLKKFGSWADV